MSTNEQLLPPDDDVELYDFNPAEQRSNYIFVSHTNADESFVRTEIKGLAMEKHFVLWIANIKGGRIAQAYKRKILCGLAMCRWFLVVVSVRALVSLWVNFEVRWAISNRTHKKIVVVCKDKCRPAALHTGLKTMPVVDFFKDEVEARGRLWAILPKWGDETTPAT